MSTLSARTARVYQERERMNEKRVLSSRVNSDWLRFLTSSYLMPYLLTYFPLTCGWLYTKVFLLSMSPSLFLSLLFSGQSVSCVGCKLFLARSVKFLLKYYEKFIQFSFVCRQRAPLKVQSKSHLVLLLLTFQLSLSPSLSSSLSPSLTSLPLSLLLPLGCSSTSVKSLNPFKFDIRLINSMRNSQFAYLAFVSTSPKAHSPEGG